MYYFEASGRKCPDHSLTPPEWRSSWSNTAHNVVMMNHYWALTRTDLCWTWVAARHPSADDARSHRLVLVLVPVAVPVEGVELPLLPVESPSLLLTTRSSSLATEASEVTLPSEVGSTLREWDQRVRQREQQKLLDLDDRCETRTTCSWSGQEPAQRSKKASPLQACCVHVAAGDRDYLLLTGNLLLAAVVEGWFFS